MRVRLQQADPLRAENGTKNIGKKPIRIKEEKTIQLLCVFNTCNHTQELTARA